MSIHPFLQLSQILKDGGAQKEFYIVPVANLIIADTVNFQNYEQAKESNLPIVTVKLRVH